MTDNELKVIRQNIACPQFGDDHYGAWGILTLYQRKTIYKMWDEITRQKAEIERLKAYYKDEFERLRITYDRVYENRMQEIKAEAIKEFAEKTNKMITQIYNNHIFGNNDLNDEEKDAIINFSDDVVSGFANLVKEMVAMCDGVVF